VKRSYGIAMIGFALCREEGGARGGGHDRHHAAFRRAGRTFSQKTTQSVSRTGDPMAAMVRANRGRARWRRRRIVDDAPPPPPSPSSSQRPPPPPPPLPCSPLVRHHLGSLSGWSSSRIAIAGDGMCGGTEKAATTDGGHRRRPSSSYPTLCDRIGRARDRVILASHYVGVGSGIYDDDDDGDGATGFGEGGLPRAPQSTTTTSARRSTRAPSSSSRVAPTRNVCCTRHWANSCRGRIWTITPSSRRAGA
jgi:hypothetical protein